MSSSSQQESILVSSARSGTNYFLSVYSAIFPDDFVVKEVFRRDGDSFTLLEQHLGLEREEILELTRRDRVALWKSIVERSSSNGRGSLAKIFYNHVLEDNPIWHHFKNNTKVIHLIRRNIFDVYVSWQIALQTGKWQNVGGPAKEITPFLISRSEAEAFIAARRGEIEWGRRLFAGKPDYHEVFYEEISANQEHCAQEISGIYGVSVPERFSIQQRKQKNVPNHEIVANYDEVADLDSYVF